MGAADEQPVRRGREAAQPLLLPVADAVARDRRPVQAVGRRQQVEPVAGEAPSRTLQRSHVEAVVAERRGGSVVRVVEDPPEVVLHAVRIPGRSAAGAAEARAAAGRGRAVVGAPDAVDVLERQAAAQAGRQRRIGSQVAARLAYQHLERGVAAQAPHFGGHRYALQRRAREHQVEGIAKPGHVGEPRVRDVAVRGQRAAAALVDQLDPRRIAGDPRARAAARAPQLRAGHFVVDAGVEPAVVGRHREERVVGGIAHAHRAVVLPGAAGGRIRVREDDRVVAQVGVEGLGRARLADRRRDQQRLAAGFPEADHGPEADGRRWHSRASHRLEGHAVRGIQDVPLQGPDGRHEQEVGAAEPARGHPAVAELARTGQPARRLECERPRAGCAVRPARRVRPDLPAAGQPRLRVLRELPGPHVELAAKPRHRPRVVVEHGALRVRAVDRLLEAELREQPEVLVAVEQWHRDGGRRQRGGDAQRRDPHAPPHVADE